MQFERLTIIDNSYEANFLKEELEEEGIPCILANENSTALMPNLYGLMGWGIQVMVPQEKLQGAIDILQRREKESKVVRCPHCNSENIRLGLGSTGWLRKASLVVISLIVWLPFGNIRSRYYCNDCKTEFAR